MSVNTPWPILLMEVVGGQNGEKKQQLSILRILIESYRERAMVNGLVYKQIKEKLGQQHFFFCYQLFIACLQIQFECDILDFTFITFKLSLVETGLVYD